mgnify:CR=1 FL=1
MKLTKQEQDIVRRKFSKYCIEVLNGEALNYLEELDRLWEQEINFSDLGESILNQFCSYDEIPESDYFQIMGMEVPVRDEAISNALYRLPEKKRKIILMAYFLDMTEKEIKNHPEAEVTGGYLKQMDYDEKVKGWWKRLTDKDKNCIKSLPNFDPDIFKEITGIDVNW